MGGGSQRGIQGKREGRFRGGRREKREVEGRGEKKLEGCKN